MRGLNFEAPSCHTDRSIFSNMLTLPLEVLMPAVESVGLVPAVRLALTCRYFKQLQTEVIGTVCKRLCSRQMTPPPCSKTRIPRITPAGRSFSVCSSKMKLALESTWLQSFVEEIDCLAMSTGAIVDCSHAFVKFQMLSFQFFSMYCCQVIIVTTHLHSANIFCTDLMLR